MKLSEVTAEVVGEYLGGDLSAKVLAVIIAAARKYVLDFTGLTEAQADEHADLSVAMLAVCGDLYDRRGTVITGTIVADNPLVAQILGAHAVNLL